MRIKALAAIASSLLAVACGGNRLKMNYGSADISTTPREHVILAGFAARHGLSDGIHQRLRTHCLVFKDGSGRRYASFPMTDGDFSSDHRHTPDIGL